MSLPETTEHALALPANPESIELRCARGELREVFQGDVMPSPEDIMILLEEAAARERQSKAS